MRRTFSCLSLVVGISTCFAFCTAVDPICLDPLDLDPASASTGQANPLSFTLMFSTEGLLATAQGGWELETDLGYRVRWHTGYLVTLRNELVPCDAAGSELDTCAQIFKWLTSPSVAHAGHGDGEPDPSRTTVGEVESLVALTPLEISGPSLDGPAYCTAHYLVSRAYGFTANLPTDVDMIGRSLFIAGEFSRPGTEAWTPFVASTSVSNGRLSAFAAASDGRTTYAHPGLGPLDVTITRHLGGLFDGIIFESLDAEALGDAVLWNLIDGTEATVQGVIRP